MKRNENKEFQSQVIFSPKLSLLSQNKTVKNSSGHFRNLAWPWVLSPLDPKCRVSNVSTSIDGTCVHRSILIFICRGISWCRSTALVAHRSIVLPLVDLYMVSSDEMSFKLQNSPNECFTLGVSIIGCKDFRQVSGAAGSVTKIGQASMNQNLMVVATKLCSLLFDIYPRVLCEKRENVINNLQGVTFQTCLKNLIPCIPSPKTSGYVRFSVENQRWLLHTFKASV
ncbi:hypothetical protein IGI04_042184 [Brassica rapa subsp. trilocularis]|uniref:Uncharacterized protein n=1 Tax=Brassica rapa subsp. trilocularis TaxID=1813537 RepID=A0ABQ7KMP3_BRACM|nr:hypothetical protein IGI04_042184 [Brassica rapa subsp. trilocularis]